MSPHAALALGKATEAVGPMQPASPLAAVAKTICALAYEPTVHSLVAVSVGAAVQSPA